MAENPTPRLLSYEPMKAILAEMSFETREKIRRKIPSLQKTNSIVPYTYDFVHISSSGIWRLNNSMWEYRYREWQDVNLVRHYDERDDFDEDGNRRTRYEYSEEESDKMPLRYLRDETRIRHLTFDGFPKCFENRNPDTLKLHVLKLTVDSKQAGLVGEKNEELFRSIAPFLKHPLKAFHFQSTPANLHLISDPLTKDCTELSLGKYGAYHGLTVEDLLRHNKMDQTHLEVAFYYWLDTIGQPNTAINFARDLVQHWINIGKTIGSTFTSPTEEYFFICDVFDELKTTFNATKSRIQELGDDFFAHCYIIPLNETSEIVAYGIKEKREYMGHACDYALKMEVRAIGSTEASESTS